MYIGDFISDLAFVGLNLRCPLYFFHRDRSPDEYKRNDTLLKGHRMSEGKENDLSPDIQAI